MNNVIVSQMPAQEAASLEQANIVLAKVKEELQHDLEGLIELTAEMSDLLQAMISDAYGSRAERLIVTLDVDKWWTQKKYKKLLVDSENEFRKVQKTVTALAQNYKGDIVQPTQQLVNKVREKFLRLAEGILNEDTFSLNDTCQKLLHTSLLA